MIHSMDIDLISLCVTPGLPLAVGYTYPCTFG